MDKYVVRKSFADSATQSNTFNNLSYAIKESDKYPKYNVYESANGNLVHESANKDTYVVRRSYNDLKSQLNTFNSITNATNQVNKYPDYKVFEAVSEKLVKESANKDKYVVRKSFNEVTTQTNTFTNLDNAKRDADNHIGYSVYDLTGKCLYTAAGGNKTKIEKFISHLESNNRVMIADVKAGIRWYYYNGKLESTFAKARSNKKYRTNCVTGVQWALVSSGVVGSDGCAWYGGKNTIVWVNKNAEANARKYFNIIKIGGAKTVKQCVSDGTLQRGDIITYVTMNHTNVYLGDGKSFDSGHAYCKGENFTKWIGSLSNANQKVGYILRLK